MLEKIIVINKAITFPLLLFFLTSTFSNCIYQNEGENFNFINSSNKEKVNVTLDFFALNDSIFLSERTVFGINVNEREIYQLRISIDDVHVSSSYSNNSITFELNPVDFSEGKHELFIAIIVSAETNSLADKLEFESVNIYKSLDLYIDKTPPKPIENFTIENNGGALLIKWELPEKLTFSRYKIVKSIVDTLGNIIHQEITDIDNQKINFFFDYYYTGGLVKYQIDIESGTYYVEGWQKEHSEEIMDIDFFITEENKIGIEWYKSTLHRNKLKFAIFEDSKHRFNIKADSEFKISTAISEILPLMQEKTLELRVYPDSVSIPEYQYYNSVKIKKLFIGKKFEECDAILYLKDRDIILTYDNGSSKGHVVRSYNSESMNLLNERIIDWAGGSSIFQASENGEYVYEWFKNEIFEIDVSSLERKSKYDFESLINQEIKRISSSFTISNNKLLSVRINDYPYLIDLNNYSIILKSNINFIQTPKISPSGKYYFHYSNIYEIGNNGVDKVFDMPSYTTVDEVFFDCSEEAILYSRISDGFLVYNMESKSLVNTLVYGTTYVKKYGIDKKTGNIYKLGYERPNWVLQLFDKNNSELIDNIKLFIQGNVYSHKYYIYNNIFFSTKGFYLDRI
jgi:hypothetical protein